MGDCEGTDRLLQGGEIGTVDVGSGSLAARDRSQLKVS